MISSSRLTLSANLDYQGKCVKLMWCSRKQTNKWITSFSFIAFSAFTIDRSASDLEVLIRLHDLGFDVDISFDLVDAVSESSTSEETEGDLDGFSIMASSTLLGLLRTEESNESFDEGRDGDDRFSNTAVSSLGALFT